MNKIIGFLFRYTGMFFFFKKVITRRKVYVAMFHNPKPEFFEKQLSFLSKHYSFIPVQTLVEALNYKDWSLIPDNSMAITFDDGHKMNYELLEILKRYKARPTIYCCSDIICTNRHYWWAEAKQEDIPRLKRMENKERLRELQHYKGYAINREYAKRHALSKDELLKMLDFVDFGSHTRFHPILTCCDLEEQFDEICISRKNIERNINKDCKHFCYPNGDYDDEVVDIVKAAGYESARTTDIGWNGKNSDPYRLRMVEIKDDDTTNSIVGQLTAIRLFLCYLLKGSFHGRHKALKPSNTK